MAAEKKNEQLALNPKNLYPKLFYSKKTAMRQKKPQCYFRINKLIKY